MVAAITIPLTLIVLYVLHSRAEDRREREANDRAEANALEASIDAAKTRLSLEAIANRPHPEPIDLSPFQLAQETVHALNARLDTINDDFQVLTTRVETGPGKRTLRLP